MDYCAIRKLFIEAFVASPQPNPPRGAGNWRRYYKERACVIFDNFVQAEREQAVRDYITARGAQYDDSPT